MEEKYLTTITTIGVVMLTALLTYFTTVRKERSQQVNRHRLEILNNLYTPIYRILYTSVFPGDGYGGIDEGRANSIIEVVEQNIELADPVLEELIWSLKEEIYIEGNNRNSYTLFDEEREVLDHVVYNYNLLRKKLNLPYDYAYFSLTEKWRIFQNNRKRRKSRVKALKEIRKQLD